MRIETLRALGAHRESALYIETLRALGAHRESALYIETLLALGAHRESATGAGRDCAWHTAHPLRLSPQPLNACN